MVVLIIVLITVAAIDDFEDNPTEKMLLVRGLYRIGGSIPSLATFFERRLAVPPVVLH